MDGRNIFFFPGEAKATLAEVGGKGLSLMEGSRHSLPVPPGFILSVRFFAPWFETLHKSAEWHAFAKATTHNLQHACTQLKHAAAHLKFSKEQSAEVADAAVRLGTGALFAVRSSSPHEDLDGASFAGGYETVLGVTQEKLHTAVLHCFVSCLDYRVAVYMQQNGFDATNPRIAVIIQKQIASEISGVGFSLNPITNNYDEAVFNANWGLGETVVAGQVSPDTYIVDKVHEKVLEARVNNKLVSKWLKDDGGTIEKTDYRTNVRTLSDQELIALTRLISKVEAIYGKPMDIEWAYQGDKLYLLQARPITAYVPLSPEMITEPHEKKRLYFDISITAEGMTRPISYMGTSTFRRLLRTVGKIAFMRDINQNIDTAIAHISDGRIHANLSTFFALAGKKKVAEVLLNMDALAVTSIVALDEATYLRGISRMRLLPYGLIWRLPGILLYIARAHRNPERAQLIIEQSCMQFERDMQALFAQDLPLVQLADRAIYTMFTRVFIKALPLVIESRIALGRMAKLVGNGTNADKLTRALPHNITIEMSLALAKLVDTIPTELSNDAFISQFNAGTLPESFMHVWKEFIRVYGIRGPEEIDIASPRYREDPAMLLGIIAAQRPSQGESPQQSFERNRHEREAAYERMHKELLAKDPKNADRFARDYRFLVAFGGFRETHKYYLVLCVALMREKVLSKGRQLVDAKRIDALENVFDLSLEQLDQAMRDNSLDLRALAARNTEFLKRLARVPRPPAVIDSRGFIPRPPTPPVQKGETAGVPISSGIVRGRIKVLHTPDEKPLKKGEILVARATDPGWTPLFVNAAAVILEVGGILQHGALVAREYGIPCVAGIDNATTLWQDGTMVEVDGTSGIIRTIS